MSSEQVSKSKVHLSVENIGGIDNLSTSFEPGVTVLAGRNATNRTSLLRSIMAAHGSDDVALKGDADEGSVELTIGDETYTRTFERQGDTVISGGNPVLDDPDLADLFAFLLETNDARQAVARGDDLRDLIMRPVDVESINEQIESLQQEKRDIADELSTLSNLSDRLPQLERRRTKLEDQIEEKEDELAEKEQEVEEYDASVSERQEVESELESKLGDLRSKRRDINDVDRRIETEKQSLDALESEEDELEDDAEDLPEVAGGRIDEIESEISRLRTRRQQIQSTVNELQSVIQFNEEMLSGTSSDVVDALRDADDSGGSVTDQLLGDDQVVCWTCGSEVDKSEIEGTLERLRTLREDKLEDNREHREQLSELEDEKSTYERRQRERDRIERRLSEIESERETRQERIEELKSDRSDLEDEIDSLEQTVDELESEEHGDLLDLHREANQLEYDLGRLRSDLEDVEDEIADIERKLDERDELEAAREDIEDELAELRTRIKRLESEAVEEFNTHMDDVLDVLEYDNLDRIWIERTEKRVREGRKKVKKSVFDLHVIRTNEDGVSYEDSVAHLSESEREVTGLVFALAGYLIHDVYETVPFMVLDSLEAIDSNRISRLVDYFADYADYLAVALLEEDAQAVDSDYPRYSPA
ncbi:chromosome segregation protein SMC [Haloferax sp. Atlit-10N]|uniref:SMC-like protein Sph2 n=1 Tax=Haloferax prahovense (strain DSM 18310 / JCM 13924 / TL6) TaxID=1227461 RepID=M0FXM6_HALPT|nr:MULTISPECIES: archaea-specific SMC-related protein [Haloferax]ELZ64003.1 SMC-like protein Sph2 [Haloferax prahovense DSM 18310]RDZ40050.1 chromosome segregation protein SMC [Haloferax sp. Atlit-19N]RDZ40265.1 chromosome segregation protein SMC [Haloferax sp. Atlit-16N]RDZ51051.1 chromosome segregation protein SMC [Haloferax sp. Atlit-4N]RDZ56808.1 chromosome segregation protein SMC [Haloferax sp. Atlit-10N]